MRGPRARAILTGADMFRGPTFPVNQEWSFMSTIARSLLDTMTRALLPPTCCLCGEQGQFPVLDLCAGCVSLLPLNARDNGAFPSYGSNVVRTLVPFHYAYPVDHLIRALKFRGERVHARVLGTLLARAFLVNGKKVACGAFFETLHGRRRQKAWFLPPASPRSCARAGESERLLALQQIVPELIVPIPLHPLRYRERGFNQAHEIARYAAQLLRIPVGTQYVRRRVPTLEQSGLSLAQRRRNVRGAFEVMRPIEARSVALVDDVLTTGSTARAAAEALSNAGVRHVEVWAVARVTLD